VTGLGRHAAAINASREALVQARIALLLIQVADQKLIPQWITLQVLAVGASAYKRYVTGVLKLTSMQAAYLVRLLCMER